MPAVRAAMNAATGQDEDGRNRLVDLINTLAANAGIRRTAGRRGYRDGRGRQLPSVYVVTCRAGRSPLSYSSRRIGFPAAA